MKIRTQFMIHIVVLGIILLLIIATAIISNQWLENAHHQEELAAQIQREVYELGYLRNEYLLYRETQQASRWQSKFASFSEHVSNLKVDTPEQQALLANIKTDQQRLQTVFAEVKASIESAPQTQDAGFDNRFMQVSWSRLQVQNQGIIFNVSRLERMLNEQEHQLERWARLLSFVLIAMLVVFLLVNYGLTFRRILQAIASLQAGTRIVGSGELDFAIPVKNEDEIGELSHAFNRMTRQLKTITASRAELEREITERKQAEEALRESEARYRGLMESQLDLIVRVDPAGCFTFVNDAYCQKFGLKREEILGRESYKPLVHPEDLPHTLEAMKALYQHPYRVIVEQRAFTVEGVRWIEWQDSAIREESGRIVEIQAIGRDITARKQAEAALRESEQRLKRAQEIAHLGSWELDLINNQLTWSDEVYRIFGLQSQEFGATYEAFLEAVHPEDRTAVDAAYSGSIQAGQDSYEIEHRVVRRSSGEVRIIHEKCEHFRNQSGQIIRSIGMVHDITERKQAEAEIASLAKFPTENPNPILRVQRDGKVTYANAASQELLEIWGCEIDDYLPQELRDFITVAVDDNSNTTADLPCNDKVYAIMFVPILESGYVNIYGRDITERKRAEEALHGLAEELRRSNAELEQFAYVASHDLQEPLRMISSYVQLLGRRYQGKLDSEADEFIAFAVDGTKRMQSLINDLLAYSRVGTRGSPLTVVSAEDLVKEALANLQFSIEESGASITHEALPVVKGDPTQLVMVFQNLLGNAIKFHGSAPPCIHIEAQREGDEWNFSVRDNGIGLDPQFAQRIFVIFQRLHDRSSYPGTGIGLAICKRIIQRHGGRIWVESELGEGATFYFTLPAKETL